MRSGLILILFWAFALVPLVDGKVTSGDFRLSGVETEKVLGSFAVSPNERGLIKVFFSSKEPYYNEQALKLRLFRDDKWPQYQKEPMCPDKAKLADQMFPVNMEPKGGRFEFETTIPIDNSQESSSHYFYVALDDCSLEFYMHDSKVPPMHFEFSAFAGGGSHLSADEQHLKTLHTFQLLISSIIAVLLGMVIFMQIHEQNSVHAAMFLVVLAAFSDAGSSLMELMHLQLYQRNGVGSYFLDALSAYMEAICDSLIALLLLSVASGWTLPSDVIGVTQNATPIQNLLEGLRTPFMAARSFNPASIFALSIFGFHIILAQWGRIYNDDFDSYHDLEHTPGKILMIFRIVLGICMVIGCFQTRMKCPQSLHPFYVKLAFVGTLWFQSLPVLTWIVNTFVAYRMRHFVVGVSGAAVQSSAIVLLAMLVTSHKGGAYQKLSHLNTKKSQDSLTERLSSANGPETARVWKFGKAKVRLD